MEEAFEALSAIERARLAETLRRRRKAA